jgi:hypothetical protein
LSVVAQAFAFVVFVSFVQVRIFLFLPVTLMRVVSGRFRLMRIGFPIGTRRCRSSEEAHSLLGRRVCAYHERTLLQNSDISVEASFELHLLYTLIHDT